MLTPTRKRMQDLMRATITDEAARHSWTYREVRPMPVPRTWSPGQTVVGDCSKGVQYICKWGGGPDPMRSGWDPYGNSQTIWLRNPHVAFAVELDVGDIVTFGHDGDQHAAMVMEAGTDPLLWSFGHQGAPNSYRLSADHRECQFVKLYINEPVPTPVEKLRAKTGFFAWVAWRQGEGQWRQYGKANRTVRPSVPKLVPASWWKRYALFLRNRKTGG